MERSSKRKPVKPTWFQNQVLAFTRVFIRARMKRKYSYDIEPVTIEGPFIMLSNHTTDNDMLFALFAVKNPMYFLCSEHLMRKSSFMKWSVNVLNEIPIFKGSVGAGPSREMLLRIREGNNICIFPEGHHTMDGCTQKLDTGCARLLKHAKCALVTFRIVGGYFVQPRWSDLWRQGPVSGKIVRVMKPEEIEKLSAEEITEIINQDLYEDAYETQQKAPREYLCDAPAQGLENAFLICPKCGSLETFKSDGPRFFCSKCGLEGCMDNYGILSGEGLPYDNVRDWFAWQQAEFHRRYDEGDVLYEKDGVTLSEILPDHSESILGEGTLTADKEGLSIGEYHFAYTSMDDMDFINRDNVMLFCVDRHNYSISAAYLGGVKYRVLFDRARKK